MVYTGGGNKALPVMGQIFRALGRGLRVCVVTFGGVDSPFSELITPQKFGDTLEIHELTICRENRKDQGSGLGKEIGQAWKSAGEFIDSGKFDMVVLDELQLLLTDQGVSARGLADYLGKRGENMFVLATIDDVPGPLALIADAITEVTETGGAD